MTTAGPTSNVPMVTPKHDFNCLADLNLLHRLHMKLTRLVALTTLMLASLAVLHAAAAERPNLLFILADDLGWADTTLYGHTKYYQTPNLERLAKRGMTFTRAYSASPLCSPTRASILTGLSPARVGITAPVCHGPQVVLTASPGKAGPPGNKATICESVTRLNTNYFTLAEALKEAGYATGHFGKWHLGAEPYSPLQQGFEVDVPHWPGPGPAGSYVAPWKFKDFDPDPAVPDQHIEDRMAKEAVAFIEQHKNKPFFLNYWMFSVHAPFDAKKALIEKHRTRVNPADPQRSPTYAAMVESMDDAVGTLLDTLNRLGLADKTVIVFTSDNGGNMYNEVDGTTPTSNAPLRGGKATLFEGGIRVPCIVSWPGVVAGGTRSDAVVQSSDFYPTLLEVLSLAPRHEQQYDGISIVPALKGRPLKREAIFSFFPHQTQVPDWLPPAVAMHSGDWKLIRIFHGGDKGAHRWKLFNLASDLGEKNDLAAQEPQRVKEMDALIEKFLANTMAVVPMPNPKFDPAAYCPADEGKVPAKTKAKQGKASAASTAKTGADPLQGWKARGCKASVQDGILKVKGTSAAPFLGFAAGKENGPATVTLRVCSATGGDGKIEWLSSPTAADARSTTYSLPGGKMQTLAIPVPATGSLGILRVYLPATPQSVEIDWIELQSGSATKPRRWDF
jgi:arylsulfatase A-like enzyme